mmetsp:Transcript_1971/g.3208  ORF Transcript_1971/g.3208 Transcript_1971/m.3208 type:complete len:90 (-) Transcript_1971:1547-1816(-)
MQHRSSCHCAGGPFPLKNCLRGAPSIAIHWVKHSTCDYDCDYDRGYGYGCSSDCDHGYVHGHDHGYAQSSLRETADRQVLGSVSDYDRL